MLLPLMFILQDRGNYREPIKVQGKEANMETGDMTCVESLHQTSIVKNLKSLFESKTQHPDAREKSPMKTSAFKKPLYLKRPPTDLPISQRESVVDSKEALVSSRNSIRAVRNFWKEKEHNQPQVSTEDHFDFGRRKLSTGSKLYYIKQPNLIWAKFNYNYYSYLY